MTPRWHRTRVRHASLSRGGSGAGGVTYDEVMTTLTERGTLELVKQAEKELQEGLRWAEAHPEAFATGQKKP